jgi:hypothetical protein
MILLSKNAALIPALCLLALAGCDTNVPAPPSTSDALVVDVPALTTRIAGVSYDPEAYLFAYGMCGGPSCTVPAYLSEGIPMYDSSILIGGEVQAFDVVKGEATASSLQPTDDHGLYTIEGVESREDPPFFLTTSGGSLIDLGSKAPFPPAPPGNYPPAFTLKPIVTRSGGCFAQQALQISDVGILQAVANAATASGTATTVNDLLDPSQHAGVGVWFLLQPGDDGTFVPATGTTISSSAGTVLNIDWAPPGALPPEAGQSDRGFYVTTEATSPIGVAVVVLGPLTGPPETITFTAVDPTTDAATARPWNFPPLDLTLAPGMVSIAPLQLMAAVDPNAGDGAPGGQPPTWLCLPSF